LVASDSSPSISSLVSGPFSHKLFSGLGFRNGLDFVSIPEEKEPSPLSCSPSEKVR